MEGSETCNRPNRSHASTCRTQMKKTEIRKAEAVRESEREVKDVMKRTESRSGGVREERAVTTGSSSLGHERMAFNVLRTS